MMPESDFGKAILAGAGFCIFLALAGGLLTQLTPWYRALRQPSWKPPDWAFGPIWTLVFICLTFAIAYAWEASTLSQRTAMVWALCLNGILNMAWSFLFFIMKSPNFALAELVVFWFSIVLLILVFGNASRMSAALLLPYITWVTVAGVLNFKIVRLNRS